jgi:hypothetical protein
VKLPNTASPINAPSPFSASYRQASDDWLRQEVRHVGNPDGTTTCRNNRLAHFHPACDAGTKICPPERATALLEPVMAPHDRMTIEGDNQKQADLLAAALANSFMRRTRPSGRF